MTLTVTISQKQKKLLQKARQLGWDLSQLVGVLKKADGWKDIRGILKKKPTGLQHQRMLRNEWL